jgi:hypothetical protein
MNQYLKKILPHFFILMLTAQCLVPLDIDTDQTKGILVISGQISTIEDMSTIYLGITAETERMPIPIPNATVILNDDQSGTYQYHADLERPGFYSANLKGTPGTTYFIEITLSSGKVYRSIPEKLPESAGYDSIYYKIETRDFVDGEGAQTTVRFFNLFSKSRLLPAEKPLFVKWSVREDYIFIPTDFPDPFGNIPPNCFVSQNADPQRIVLYNGEEATASLLPEFLLASRVLDFTFLGRHYFTTYQSSITSEAYAYWQKVNLVANQVGTIFDTPPAKITGNLYNIDDEDEIIFGYFQSVNQTQSRFFMLPNDLPFALSPYCRYDARKQPNEYPTICIDCTKAPNSSYRRPDWF